MPRTAAILVAMSLVTPLPLFAARESNLGPTISAVRPADAPPPRIPETPAGRLLASWLEAHNRGDGSSLETWLRRSFSDTRLANMNVDRALAWYLESTRMFGKLAEKPYHVVEDEPHRLVVWFLDAELEETANPDPTKVIVVEVDVDPDDPAHLARGLGLGSLACELREGR